MNANANLPIPPLNLEIDLSRTERPDGIDEVFYWKDDNLIHTGKGRVKMGKSLALLPKTLKASFKANIISFSKLGGYSPNSYIGFFRTLMTAMNAFPTSKFDINWISKALTNTSFHRYKSGITQFFLHWNESDNSAICKEALLFLHDSAAYPAGPRNVLSDNPEKSWLLDDEYEALLSAIWNNYEDSISSTQVTLIKILSMQYARRPRQIALLKICDIRESNNSDTQPLGTKIIDFPGIKDINAETDFRDSKFEPQPLAEHLWNLCLTQIEEVKNLYQKTFGLCLADHQLKKLPLFCSEMRINEARKILEEHYQLPLMENLDSELFHLQKLQMTNIIRWISNTPNCTYGADNRHRLLRPKPPISLRTGKMLVVTATRIRHTRTRQLARQGVPRYVLSHWLGHTSLKSLDAYYNDPAEQARQLDEAMSPLLTPLAMAFAGTLIDSEMHATRANDPTSKLEFSKAGTLRSVGHCGKHSFCATTSVPIPCYRCRHFEPLLEAPHQEVLEALLLRQEAEIQALKIGGVRNLLIPIDLTADIRAVENCIDRCLARKAELETSL